MAMHESTKHSQLTKAQTTMLFTVAVAVVVVIFCLFGIKATLSRGAYNQRVLSAKHKVIDQLKSNLSAAQQLAKAYQTFASADPNVLGGSSKGTSGATDGNNAQIVLDALPSKYDTPALASSIEKLSSSAGVTISSITVTDNAASNPSTPQANALPQTMPFSVGVQGTYATDQQLLKIFESSIRPFDVTNLVLSGSDATLTMTLNVNTYWQPQTSVNVNTKQAVQ